MAAPGNYFPDRHDNKVGVGYPTLCMSSEIKKDPKGTKWLFMKITAHEIKNGRFDTDVYVVDEEGELVALSKHVSLITEVKGKSLDMSKAVKL
jgi:archaeosine-15-forming tRNA-guanine transglycosylase